MKPEARMTKKFGARVLFSDFVIKISFGFPWRELVER
jgi:hypothetical protein